MQITNRPILSPDWVFAFLEQYAQEKPVLIAVSGGLDSMVLWDLVFKSGYPYAVAHVNYHLRKEESELDEILVSKIAEQRGVSCFIYQDYTLTKNSKGLQAEARTIRYTFFESLSEQFPFVCTAHHEDDQIETILLQWARGGGPQAIAGMYSVGMQRLRPLLYFSKRELADYAQKEAVRFREDESNATDNYLRNRVRHHFAPLGEQLFVGFRQNITRAALQQQALLSFASSLVPEQLQLLRSNKYPHALKRRDLAQLSGLQFFIHEILKKFDFPAEKIDMIVSAIGDSVNQKRRYLNRKETVRLIISGDTIHLEKTYPLSSFEHQVEDVGEYDSPLGTLEVFELDDQQGSSSDSEIYVSSLDSLVWRTMKASDSLSISKTQSKSAKRVLAEAKVPGLSSNTSSLIEQNGVPIWIVGLRKSSTLKTSKAKTGYCLRFTSCLIEKGIISF